MKAFFEAFPNVQLPKNLHDLMEQTNIEKITTTKAKDFLRIYLVSRNLIDKKDIYKVEKEIKRQLFSGIAIEIKIYERFELSAQYTPEKLLNVYRESILDELMEYSHVLFIALKTAQFSYPEDGRVVVNLEDSVLVRSREEELHHILEKILVERCGFGVRIELEYREKERSEEREEEERLISLKVAEITNRLKGYEPRDGKTSENADGEASASDGEEAQKAQQEKEQGTSEKSASGDGAQKGAAAGAAGKTGELRAGSGGKLNTGRGEFSKFKKGDRGGFDRGSVKKSDNPDVIYGRDFEEEPHKIEDIIGEIGEVVVQGKILKLETREIKNEKTLIYFDLTDFSDTMTVKLFVKTEQASEVTGVHQGQGYCHDGQVRPRADHRFHRRNQEDGRFLREQVRRCTQEARRAALSYEDE